MTRTEWREWLQTLGLVFIPIAVTCMGNKVAKSNATRETNAEYVKTAVGILSAPPTDFNRPLRPWALQVFQHFSPVPLTDTAEAVLSSYQLALKLLSATPPKYNAELDPSYVFVNPRVVTLQVNEPFRFLAIGLTSTLETVPVPGWAVSWSVTGGSMTDT